MSEIVIESIEERISTNYPNQETIKVITKIEEGKGLVKAKDAQDLFKKLGLNETGSHSDLF